MRQAWQGPSGLGLACFGTVSHGEAWHGLASWDLVGQARRGASRYGWVWLGGAGVATRGSAWRAWFGMAGKARQGGVGRGRHG